jgi:hypothetical protein
MRKALSVVVAVVMLVPAVSVQAADDHVVSRADVSAALAAGADARSRDLSRLDKWLSEPEAARAASLVNADLANVRSALASLGDAELRDLAARAEALDANPVAGALDPDIRQLLIIFLIIAIVILVFQAID